VNVAVYLPAHEASYTVKSGNTKWMKVTPLYEELKVEN